MNPVLSRRRPWRDDPHLRLAVRLARSLACLSSFGSLQQGMMRLHNRVAALQATWQRLQVAEERSWHRSRGMLLQQLSDGIVELRNSLGDLQHPITEAGYRPQVPIRSIHEELLAAKDEFDSFTIDPVTGILSIMTDAVELEEIDLGRFRIEIDPSLIPTRQVLTAVRTVALDPFPAANDPAVTHPHVRAEAPCLGEASLPVVNALREGRLCDAFQLIVCIENLAVQGYTPQDLQQTKVDCTAKACLQIHPELIMEAIPARFTRRTTLSPVRDRMAVFACVDSMASRQILFQQCHSRASFFVDGRMAGEVLRVITSNDPPVDTSYVKTLFEDRSAYPAPCTGRSTLYAASIAAGLMLSRFTAHLRGQGVATDSLLNLMADEWTVL